MRLIRTIQSVVRGVVTAACIVLPAVPVSAATEGSGLSTKVGRPGTSWSQSLNLIPGELVNVLITYTNQGEFVQKYVTIHDTLPTGAVFSKGSAYLFNSAAPQGAQQADTLTTKGINSGPIKPGETVFIQFQMNMPAMNEISCGSRQVINRADAVSASGNKTYSARNTLTLTRHCTTTPTTTPTTPPTTVTTTQQTTTPTTTTATATTRTTASTDRVRPVVATASATATSQQAAPAQTVAAAPSSDSKSLVNTGPGSVLLIALAAVIVGAIGSRVVLYRVFGS